VNDVRPSIIPTTEQIEAEIAFHQDQIKILRAHLRTSRSLDKQRQNQPLLALIKDSEPEPETEKGEAS